MVRRGLHDALTPRRTGRVTRLVGLRLEVDGLEAAVGDAVRIWRGGGVLEAEVVAVQGSTLACMPLGDLTGVRFGDPAEALGRPLPLRVGEGLLGRVLDGLGRPIDDGAPLTHGEEVSVDAAPPHPLRRELVNGWASLPDRA
jgi:flagellum-specific ATP synthase